MKKHQDRVAIVIMSGGKDSRIGVPRATLPGQKKQGSAKSRDCLWTWFGISDGIRAAHD